MRSKDEKAQKRAYSVLLDALTRVMPAPEVRRERDRLFEDDQLVEVTTFSDCTVISARGTPRVAWRVATAACSLASNLLKLGLFCRGGIASGELVHQGGVVLGEGMVRAYSLESTSAVYPRIVLEDCIAEAMQTQFATPEEVLAPIVEDADGLWYVDVYRRFLYEATQEEKNLVHGTVLEGKTDTDLGHVAKWRWAEKKLKRAQQDVEEWHSHRSPQ